MGTFRTYTLKVQGSYITLKDITIENNAAKLGQAVALHTEGDHILVQNCRLLGNQDTVYTGVGGTRVAFYDCYIEGTTDFIFGPSIAWFQNCEIHSKANSYITAASTPAGQKYGYVFYKCRLTADKDVDKVYLGRPWRPFAATISWIVNWANISVQKDGTTGIMPRTKKQPAMQNMATKAKEHQPRIV